MDVQLSQHELAVALARVEHTGVARNTLTSLNNVAITVQGETGVIRFRTTDLTTQTEMQLPIPPAPNDLCVVPIAPLAALIAKIPTANVRLQTTDQGLRITAGRTTATLRTMSADQAPPMLTTEVSDQAVTWTTTDALWRTIARRHLATVSLDASRPVLQGILFKFHGASVTVVSTDGSRLSYSRYSLADLDHPVSEPVSAVFPVSFVQALSKFSGTLTVTTNGRMATVDLEGHGTLTARCLHGEYPDYERVIPTQYPLQFTVSRDLLLAVIQRSLIITSHDRDKVMALTLSSETDLVLSAVSQTTGDNEEYLDITDFHSDQPLQTDARYLFNPLFLADALRTVQDPHCHFAITGTQSPMQITSAQDADYFTLVLPLRQLDPPQTQAS